MTGSAPSVVDVCDLPPADLGLVLLAIDPIGLGGVMVRGEGADAWVEAAVALLRRTGGDITVRRLPASASIDRVRGGLDLSASLAAQAPRLETGLLTEADGGVLVLRGAERLGADTLGALLAAMDTGEICVTHGGAQMFSPARFTLIASTEDGEAPTPAGALADRLGLHLSTSGRPTLRLDFVQRIADARRRLTRVRPRPEDMRALCAAAASISVASSRAERFAGKAACALAALAGRTHPTPEDLARAAALVLAPRALCAPPESSAPPPPPEMQDAAGPADGDRKADTSDPSTRSPATRADSGQDIVVQAVRAALPAEMFGAHAQPPPRGARDGGRRALGPARRGAVRGPRVGTGRVAREIRDLAIVETLKAAAPWRRIRTMQGADKRLRVWPSDLRVHRRTPQPRGLVTLLVDASGSSAAHRLAEAKGAAELLLDRCYARRDQVALVAFRGDGAEVLLPPTRSLTRVRRRLGEMVAGGATPLAAALDVGGALSVHARDKGTTPLVVILSDGRANRARDGSEGRAASHADALLAAAGFRDRRLPAVFLDTSPRGEGQARALAEAMGARYSHLPYVQADAVVGVIAAVRR